MPGRHDPFRGGKMPRFLDRGVKACSLIQAARVKTFAMMQVDYRE
jgi:hypothetical protein